MPNPNGNPDWRKGKSGNPTGRPPKGRAFTELLEAAGELTQTLADENGEVDIVVRKDAMANMIWDFVLTGQVDLPGGKRIRARHFDEWFNAVKFIYHHIDGPPPKQMELSGSGPNGEILLEHAANVEQIETSLGALGNVLLKLATGEDNGGGNSPIT